MNLNDMGWQKLQKGRVPGSKQSYILTYSSRKRENLSQLWFQSNRIQNFNILFTPLQGPIQKPVHCMKVEQSIVRSLVTHILMLVSA